GVGHPGLDPRLAVAPGPCPLTTRHRLVVGEAVVPYQAVVHGPLGSSRHTLGGSLSEGTEQDIGDALAGLDVAGGYGRRGLGGDDRTGGGMEVHRAVAAAVGRDGGIGGDTDGVVETGPGHSLGSVEVGFDLTVGTVEVGPDGSPSIVTTTRMGTSMSPHSITSANR